MESKFIELKDISGINVINVEQCLIITRNYEKIENSFVITFINGEKLILKFEDQKVMSEEYVRLMRFINVSSVIKY